MAQSKIVTGDMISLKEAILIIETDRELKRLQKERSDRRAAKARRRAYKMKMLKWRQKILAAAS